VINSILSSCEYLCSCIYSAKSVTAETAKYFGFGLVSVKAVTRILVLAWFRLRP